MTNSKSENNTHNQVKKQYSKYVSFGQKLYEWRKKAMLTQETLAERVGVSVSYISNLERNFSASSKDGKPEPSKELVDKMSQVLGVSKVDMRLAAGYLPYEIGETDLLNEAKFLFDDEGQLTAEDKDDLRRILRSAKLTIDDNRRRRAVEQK